MNTIRTTFCLLVTTALVLVPASAGTCREAKLCCPGRDSSCVVQKAPLNDIIQDLTDKPCYCDHACLKLGDCCRDFKEACGVVDCQVSPWADWSSCDADCGSGTMRRRRTVVVQQQNGGRHCPQLEQLRGCQVNNCHHHQDTAVREIAILLPGTLSKTRKANATADIRRNLHISYPEDHPEYDPSKQYCVEFQVVKASKACKKDESFAGMKEGETVCVLCEAEALRKNLGYRCQGHGVVGLFTRWSSMSSPHCHGKWVRAPPKPSTPTNNNPQETCSAKTCQATSEQRFIFV